MAQEPTFDVDLLPLFRAYIAQLDLFSLKQKLLVALSGGVDSVVLVHLLHKAGYDFALAHCNFQLRGQESEADEQFAQQIAQQYQKQLFLKRFDLPQLQKQQADSLSVQMVARQARYEFFRAIAQEQAFDYILTAHHQDDSAETILLNLVRGTGIAGLHGILPKQNDIVRPLLFANKQQIKQYALAQSLTWREDSSNLSTKYIRNQIRLEIMPKLKKINPQWEKTLQETAERIIASENIIRQQVLSFSQKAIKKVDNSISINIDLLTKQAEPTLLLWYVLQPYHFSYRHCKQIMQGLLGQAGKVFQNKHYKIIKDRQEMHLQPITNQDLLNTSQTAIIGYIYKENTSFILQNIQFEVYFLPKTPDFVIDKNANIACLDADKLLFPLALRLWQAGDYFYPLGMRNKQKISDFLINNKVSLLAKQQTYVLVDSQGQIVWLVGKRIDNRFALQANTQEVCQIILK